MGVISNKISRDELEIGDHIYTYRSCKTYSHHGMYVGDGKVIQFTREAGLDFGSSTIDISAWKYKPCVKCGHQRKLHGVVSSCLDCFLKDGKLYRYGYNVDKATFLVKRGGTCTMATSDPLDKVVFRAKFLLTENGFGNYRLLHNNCEDFAIYCKTGKVVLSVTKLGSSSQANLVFAARLASKNVFPLAVGCVVGGFTGMAFVGYVHYCKIRLNFDISVRKDAVKVRVEELAAFIEARNNNK